MGRRLSLLPLLGLIAIGYAAKCPKQRTSPGREILCYTSTSDVKTLEDSICRCTTLVHQGHDLQDLSTSGIEEFQKSLKESNPVLQFVLSVNDNEESLKTSASVRLEAATRIVRILNEIDGIELNVTAGTKERLVHFVQGLKTEMVRKSRDKRILLVLPTKPQDLAKQFDLKALSKYVDLFTVPTHYLIDDDEAFRTFHPSRLMGLFDMLNTDSLVDLVTGLGVGKRKILISLPASVYKFTLENSKENAPRATTKEKEPTEISRSEMCEAMEKGEWIIERDEDLTAPYAFKDDTWIAFEDKISAGIKGKYVLLRDLAGLGIHNIERDSKSKCGKSLTEEVYHSFTDNKRKTREAVLTSLQEDIQQKPNPYPDHVKSSEFRIVRVVDTDGKVHASRENMQTEFSCPRQGYFVHPKSCNRFYRCVKFNQEIEDYSVFEFDCPAGLAFDERTEVCVWPGSITEGSACPGSSEIAPSKGPKFTCPDKAGYYADPQNCRFFYACYDLGEHQLTAYEFRCPYGLMFDEEKLICEWPYLVPRCGGGTYNRNDYGGGGSDSQGPGHGGYGGAGHGGSGGKGGNANQHTTSSGGGYGESGHGGQDAGHGSYGGDRHTTVRGGSKGGYDNKHTTVHSGYGRTDRHGGSGGGYNNGHTTDNSGYGGKDTHGGSEGGYNTGHTTVHSGYGGKDAHGGSEGGYNTGHTTVHSGYGGKDAHGGSEGGYNTGHTTVHSGYGVKDAHGGSEGGYNTGHTTVHSGYGGKDAHGGSEGGYNTGHTTIHSGYGGKDAHGGSEGGYNTGHTTVHSGYGGKDAHGGSEGGYNTGHTTVHSGYGGNDANGGSEGGYNTGHTTVHSGYGGKDAHGGSEGGYNTGHTTIHSGYGGKDAHGGSEGGYNTGHTTVHSGYGGKDAHGGSEGGYNTGHTTVHSGYGGKDAHGGSEGGYNTGHTTVHSGYGGKDAHGGSEGGYNTGHTTVHSGYGGKDAHGGSEGGYNTGHTTVHSGYGGKDAHGGSDGGYNNGQTTVHSGIGGGNVHIGTSEGGYSSGHTIHSGFETGGHTTVHSGYGVKDAHGGSEGGHNTGYTTIHSGYGGKDAHGGSEGGYNTGHTTVHSGYGGNDAHGGSEGGYNTGHTTVHSGYGGKDAHGGSEGGYNTGHTTVHSGYGGKDAHGGSEGGYNTGHTTVHSGYGGKDAHGGSEGGYNTGHTTVHSGYGGKDAHGGSEGGYNTGHTTVHSGYGGKDAHGGSEGGYNTGHTTIHSGYGGKDAHGGSDGGYNNGQTTVHSGIGGGNVHIGTSEGGYSSGHTIHSGFETGGHTTVHSGYGVKDAHGGSEGGHNTGYTTIHSGYGGKDAHGGSEEGYNTGHTTVHSGYGGKDAHGGSEGGYNTGHTTVHSGYGLKDTHGGSQGGHNTGHTTVHSGYGGNNAHVGTSEGGYSDGHTIHSEFEAGGHTTIHSGYGSGSSHVGSDGESQSTGYSGESGSIEGTSGIKESFGHGYQTDGGIPTLDKSVYTGITSGVYDGHTPIIQYGGQTGSADTHGIDHSAGEGSFSISENSGSTVYHGNVGPSEGGGYTYSDRDLYQKNTGSSGGYTGGISTGSITGDSATHGVIGTVDSTSGTVLTHGDVSGTVLTGTDEQGEIISGINQPGYVQTHSGTPGYVVTNGVKTTYDDYSSKGTLTHGIGNEEVIITGSQASGVVLDGHSSPGTYLTGQTSPGVIVGGAGRPGTPTADQTGGYYNTGGSGLSIHSGTAGSIAPSGQEYFTGGAGVPNLAKNPFIGISKNTGYKTNEYHDNGGRGTIRYNNGEVTHKYTEDDVRDYHTQFGTFPKFDAASYEMSLGDFTKTGPTKTGITTAQLGGSATYVSGTAKPRPFLNMENIGANAFSGSSVYSDASSKTSEDVSYETSTSSQDVSYTGIRSDYESGSIDVSKIYLGSTESSREKSSSGYSYTKPAIQFNTFGVSDTAKAPLSPIKQEIPVYSTSPAPFLNVHVYNNPSIVTSSPITSAPAVVNNYTYRKPSSVQYQETMYQAAHLPSSSTGGASTDIYSRPIVKTNQRAFPSLSSTVSPIAFTTGPLENFKTTVFKAARIPGFISTVQPVIDTGYKTVVSSTQYPINVNANNFGYSQSTGYRTVSHPTKDNSALDINVSFQPHLSTQGQYEAVAPPVVVESSEYGESRRPSVGQSVGTYKRPVVLETENNGSTGSSDYSETDDYSDYSYKQSGGTFGQKISEGSVTPTAIYRTPIVTPSPEIYNVPASMTASAIGVTYRPPFQVVTPRPTARVPSEGYSYSEPSVKFVSTTSPSIKYKYPIGEGYESQTKNTGGSPTNLGISRTEVEKLITNYDRGGAKYTPSGYETYGVDRREETTLNTAGYTSQQSYSQNFGQSYDSGKMLSVDKSQSGEYGRAYSTTPSYQLNTETREFGNRVETSSSRTYGAIKENSDSSSKLGYVPSTTHLPISQSSLGFSRKSYPSRGPSSYGDTTPAVTTYSGGYSKGSSTLSYESTTTKSLGKPRERGKVIVKFSDLHPLLLGKLGAECTCKADPFASFRGGKPLPINSSRGRVDLSNYDESEVYVDLESSKEKDDYDSSEYITNSRDSTKSDYDDGKYETPVVAVFDGSTSSTKGAEAIKSRRPSSTYLPVSSSTYLPPVSSAKHSSRGNTRASYSNNDVSVSASFMGERRGGFRTGKSLGGSERSSSNTLAGQGSTFDRYGPGGFRAVDETLQGTSDCARPGLFRHPNYCNKFYACHWDEWKKKFTLHVFNCPVHLTFDSGASACNWPSKGPACQDDNLLV